MGHCIVAWDFCAQPCLQLVFIPSEYEALSSCSVYEGCKGVIAFFFLLPAEPGALCGGFFGKCGHAHYE